MVVPTESRTWKGQGFAKKMAELVSLAIVIAIADPTGAGEGPTVTPIWAATTAPRTTRDRRVRNFGIMSGLQPGIATWNIAGPAAIPEADSSGRDGRPRGGARVFALRSGAGLRALYLRVPPTREDTQELACAS